MCPVFGNIFILYCNIIGQTPYSLFKNDLSEILNSKLLSNKIYVKVDQ